MPLDLRKLRESKYKDIMISFLAAAFLLVAMLLAGSFGSIIFQWVLLLLSLTLILKSADLFLDGAKALAKRMGISEFLIGLTLVSIGTSIPEIASTGMASYRGHADHAIGNIYGSVLVQITFIMGIVVLFCPIKTEKTVILRDGLCMLGAVLILTVFAWPIKEGVKGVVVRWEAGILISLYVLYIIGLVIYYRKKGNEGGEVEEEERDKEGKSEGGSSLLGPLFLLALGLGFVVWASSQMVDSAGTIAAHHHLKESVVGTAITAFGTSVPELVVAAVAIRKAQGLALGTLIGSNITDPLFSIGIAAMINPVSVSESITVFHFLVPITIIACVVALWFMRTGFKLSRMEGTSLVLLYLLTIVGLFMGWSFSDIPIP